MSMNRMTGRHECDRCGADVDNGGVARCAIVSDLDPDNPGMVINYEFCRDRPDDDGGVIKGCARRLVVPSMLAHFTERQEAARG